MTLAFARQMRNALAHRCFKVNPEKHPDKALIGKIEGGFDFWAIASAALAWRWLKRPSRTLPKAWPGFMSKAAMRQVAHCGLGNTCDAGWGGSRVVSLHNGKKKKPAEAGSCSASYGRSYFFLFLLPASTDSDSNQGKAD